MPTACGLDHLAHTFLDDHRIFALGGFGRQEAAVELRTAIVAIDTLGFVFEIALLAETSIVVAMAVWWKNRSVSE